MRLTLSTLARSVVDQVDIGYDLPRAFLLEQTLQTYKINGVVEHLKKYGDFWFVERTLSRHKRSGYTPLLLPEQVFAMVQGLDDFTWSLWAELCAIHPDHYRILQDAIEKAKFTVPSVSYAITIYKGNAAHVTQMVEMQRIAAVTSFVAPKRSITPVSLAAWADIRDRL